MSYPKNIIQMRPNQGVNSDQAPSEIGPDFYSNASNINFRDGFPRRVFGVRDAYTAVSPIRNIINAPDFGPNYWMVAGVNTVFAMDDTGSLDITPVGGLATVTAPNQITSSLLNGIYCFNNQSDEPHYWTMDIADNLQILPGWPVGETTAALRPFKFHLFALGNFTASDNFPMQLKWSNSAEPGAVPSEWVPTPANDAGDVILAATPGAIIDARALRGSLMIYKQHSAYIADYVGGQFVYAFRKLFVTTGVLTRNCIADYQQHQYIFADGDLVRTDGNEVVSIADKKMRKFVFRQIDQINFTSSFVVSYEAQKEIWFCFAETGANFPTIAAIWSVEDNSWGVRSLTEIVHAAVGVVSDLPPVESWDSDPDAWETDLTNWNETTFSEAARSMLVATSDDPTPTDSAFFEVDVGNTFDGAPVNATLTKSDMHFDEPDRLKIIKRVYPKVRSNIGALIQVRVGSADEPGGAILWSNSVTFEKGGQEIIDTFAQGKYLAVEFSSTTPDPWELMGFGLEMEIRGYH